MRTKLLFARSQPTKGYIFLMVVDRTNKQEAQTFVPISIKNGDILRWDPPWIKNGSALSEAWDVIRVSRRDGKPWYVEIVEPYIDDTGILCH